jgi:S-adenosylmethionine:tRNA ribosyltransferase-isomerase
VNTLVLSPTNEAHEPPEARGLARDGIRLLVSRGDEEPIDTTFRQLGTSSSRATFSS